MEPDVVRMYSSSPPPLDEDGEEEDDDDFGEFGGYCCGVSSSFSFSDYDMPTAFDQSFEKDTSPPDLYNTFTQSVGQPGKELALKETEKITKDQEAPNPELPVCETDVVLDSVNVKMETSEVLPNGPLSPDYEREVSVDSVTRKHGTSERQDFQLICKDDQQHQSNNSKTAQLGQCLCNGPFTLCTDKDLVQPLVTSKNSTESVVVSSTKDFTTETETAFRKERPIDSQQLLEDGIPQSKVSEDMDTLAGKEVTKSQEVDSSQAGEDQSNKEQMEKEETEEHMPFGPSDASFCEIQIPSGSEGLKDVADTSLTPSAENVSMSDTQENVEVCSGTPPSPVVKGPLVVSGTVELGEDFEEACLPVVDQLVIELDAEADLVLKEVQRVVLGSSVESDEDFGDFRDSTQGFPDVSQTESMSQEGFADFVTALSDCSSHDEFVDAETLKDLKEEDDLAAEGKYDNDNDNYNNVDAKNHEMLCSELPPRDSFADFSSAPFEDVAGTTSECWAAFGQQEVCEEQQESWAAFEVEQQNSTATAPSDSLQADNVLVSVSIIPRWNSCNKPENYIPKLHLSVQRLKELALKEKLPNMKSYFSKPIPPYPTPVEFWVSDVAHVTDKRGFEGILKSEQFEILKWEHLTPPESELSWWELKINEEEKRLAEKCYMKNNFLKQVEAMNEPTPFLEKFTTSPLFQLEKSRFGNYRFTFPLADLMEWYKEQNCGGEEPVLRVYGTITYKKLIMYTVLIHSPENNEDFESYPLLEASEWVRYQDGKIIWKAQAICKTHRYQFDSGEVQSLNDHDEWFYVWDQVSLVFHLPEGKTLKIPRERLIEALEACELDESVDLSKSRGELIEEVKMKVSELKKRAKRGGERIKRG